MLKKGQTLIFEDGCYSNFSYSGPFIIAKDFDGNAELKRYLEETGEEEARYSEAYKFVVWLWKGGFIEDVDNCFSWYLGDYGLEPGSLPHNSDKLADLDKLDDL